MNKKRIPEMPALGTNLRKERRKQQLSLDALASMSGVSKAMLSQIESEKVNPTIATMWKIAHALNIGFDILIKGGAAPSKKFDVTRKSELTSITTDHSSAVFKVLSPLNMAEDLEFYIMTLPPGCAHRSTPHTPGTEEILTVLSGHVKITADENSVSLGQGDSILFQADTQHTIENMGKKNAELYMLVRFPNH